MDRSNFDTEAIREASDAINQLANAVEEGRVELNSKVDQKIMEDNQGDIAETTFKPQYDTDVDAKLSEQVSTITQAGTVAENSADDIDDRSQIINNTIGNGI